MIKRTFYGWADPRSGKYRVSKYPADAPVRPSVELEKEQVLAFMERSRATILWWPPLSRAQSLT